MTTQRWYHLEVRQAVSIAGQVTDALTGAPIPGARVEIIEGPPAFQTLRDVLARDPAWGQQAERLDRTFSRSDGIYLFVDLPAGIYQLRVSAPRPRSRYGTGALTVSATRDPAGRIMLDPADVVLSPTRIHGRVTRVDNGEPVAGARVRLRGDTTVVRTDADGQYALAGLVASKPTLEVSAANFDTASRAVSLEAGQDQTVDIALQPA